VAAGIARLMLMDHLAQRHTAIHEAGHQHQGIISRELWDRVHDFLQSRLAHRIQELAYGGLKSDTVARLEALGEKLDGGNVVLRRIRADDRPIAGTRLVREYQGVEHVVTVLADGFEYDGRPYRSLSAITRTSRRRIISSGTAPCSAHCPGREFSPPIPNSEEAEFSSRLPRPPLQLLR
jgi:Protein of unknown function (DUF2924)